VSIGFNVPLDTCITGHFGDEPSRAIDCTGILKTENKEPNTYTYTRNTRQTDKTSLTKLARKGLWEYFVEFVIIHMY